MIITINGRKGTGKDTCAKLLYHLLNGLQNNREIIQLTKLEIDGIGTKTWHIKKFATKAVESFKCITGTDYHGVPYQNKNKIRETFIKYVQHCKLIFGVSIWADALFRDYNNQNWIISDLRFKSELNKIKEHPYKTIKIISHKTWNQWCNHFDLPQMIYNETQEYIPIEDFFLQWKSLIDSDIVGKNDEQCGENIYVDIHKKYYEDDTENQLDRTSFDFIIINRFYESMDESLDFMLNQLIEMLNQWKLK